MGHGSLPLVALALLVVSTLVASGSIHVQVGKPRERKWTAKNTAAESPLRIFAAASHMTKEGCHYLLRTAAHYQIDLQIIGMNDERLTQKLQKASRTSIKLLAAYELARVLPEDSLIMLVDAFDVVFQRGIADILEAYDSLGSPDILFSAEANCWPPVLATFGYCDLAPDVAGSKYLNSGGVIGRAGPLARLWKVLIAEEESNWKMYNSRGIYWDDQGTCHLSYLVGNLFNITLDSQSKIFLAALDDRPDFGTSGELLVNGSHEGVPAMVHFNGYAKTQLWHSHDWFDVHYPRNEDFTFRLGVAEKRTSYAQLCSQYYTPTG